MKYYLYNFFFLGGYSVYAWICFYQQIPEPLYSTILTFGFISHIMFIGCIILSNRHIKNIYANKSSDKFLIQTYSFLRWTPKSLIIYPGNIKAVKTSKYLRKMNLYYISFESNFNIFRLFNVLVFRPHNTTQMFDKIFKSKLNSSNKNSSSNLFKWF